MPSPTPVKITPAASPRRCAGTHGRTAGGAITIRTAAGKAGAEAPEDEPGEGERRGAGEERGRGEEHHPAHQVGIGIRAASARPASAPAR